MAIFHRAFRLHPPRKSAAFFIALALSAVPASARDEEPRQVNDDTVTARDVAITPIEDLNLENDEIPPLLLAAQADPYAYKGFKRCNQYTAAITELDQVLGPDFDLTQPDERALSAGGVAKSVVGALIPFRGVIRELSGANKHQRQFQDAIMAGVMRRAFLKGMGLKLGCKYPARPADEVTRARMAGQQALKLRAEKREDDS